MNEHKDMKMSQFVRWLVTWKKKKKIGALFTKQSERPGEITCMTTAND